MTKDKEEAIVSDDSSSQEELEQAIKTDRVIGGLTIRQLHEKYKQHGLSRSKIGRMVKGLKRGKSIGKSKTSHPIPKSQNLDLFLNPENFVTDIMAYASQGARFRSFWNQLPEDFKQIVVPQHRNDGKENIDPMDKHLDRMIKIAEIRALQGRESSNADKLTQALTQQLLSQTLTNMKNRPSTVEEIRSSLAMVETLKELGAKLNPNQRNTIKDLAELFNSKGLKDVASGFLKLLEDFRAQGQQAIPMPQYYEPEEVEIAERTLPPEVININNRPVKNNPTSKKEKKRPRMETFASEMTDEVVRKAQGMPHADSTYGLEKPKKRKSMSTFAPEPTEEEVT